MTQNDRNSRIDATAAEIKLADLKNAIGEDVTIERIRKSDRDTQYRIHGTISHVDETGVYMTRKTTDRVRVVKLAEIVKLNVWGTGQPGSPAYAKVVDQYDWLNEATRVVDEADGRTNCPIGDSVVVPALRMPKDADGNDLVAGSAYVSTISAASYFRRLLVFRYAHVEDDGSRTLVFEGTDGLEGWGESSVTNLRLVPPAPGELAEAWGK